MSLFWLLEMDQSLLLLWGCHVFLQFSWRWTVAEWECFGWLWVMLTKSEVGRPPTSAPLEYGGTGPEQKGATSCWDAETGLEVMGRRGKKSLACGMAQNELLPSFCSSASQWEWSLEGQITRPQNHKLQQNGELPKKKREKSCLAELISCHLWWFGWTYDEVIFISALMSAQTVEQGGGNDCNIFFYFFAPTILI